MSRPVRRPSARVRAALRGLAGDRGGSLLVWFAIALVPLTFAVGAGLDYGRSVNLRTRMQNATDAAALAGAVLYTDSTTATKALATAAATNYMTAFVSQMGTSYGITYTVTPTAVGSGGTVTKYTMVVTASGALPTTLMKIGGKSSTTVGTSSTAVNPVYTVTLSLSGFSSSAADSDAIYYYVVPSDNSAPAASAMTLFANTGGKSGNSGSYACNASSTSSTSGCCSNDGLSPSTGSTGSTATLQLTGSQSIGFALRNVTGGQSYYNSNSYGAKGYCINWFYSNIYPPAKYTYSGYTTNRSLKTSMTSTSPTTGTTSSLPTYATLNCSQASGKTVYYFWNDMGGSGSDDLDYNDAEYTVTCSKNDSSAATGVVLTN